MNANELFNLLESLGLHQVTRRNNNVMACCPNHRENRPSWGISVEPPHFHGCFSCGFKGVLYDLLLRQGYSQRKARTVSNTSEANFRGLTTFNRDLKIKQIDQRLLYPYDLTSLARAYLCRRGISLTIARQCGVTYDHFRKRLLFPWYVGSDLLVVTGRLLFDQPDLPKTIPLFDSGDSKEKLLYLPFRQISEGRIFLVEGEIDALKIATVGINNVAALGFGAFTKLQKNLVLNSPAHEIVLCFDNDKTGWRLTKEALEFFTGKKKIARVDYTPFKSRYDDLDPAELSQKDLLLMLKKVTVNADWTVF